MTPSRIRYVTACQQLLALVVVAAALVPAATVVSLDVIAQAPATGAGTGPAAGAQESPLRPGAVLQAATVPTAPVEPEVTEVALTDTAGQVVGERPRRTATVLARRGAQAHDAPRHEMTAAPAPVTGFGTVGITWAPGTEVADDEIALRLRTRTDGEWSSWSPMSYHDEHGPDAGSPEARTARPGTDEVLVGDVDAVQVAVASDAALPDDLSLAVVTPGEAGAVEQEQPALTAPGAHQDSTRSAARSGDGIALRVAQRAVAQPTIYSRAQWGADERIRDQSAPAYGTVQGGFVHHTVNANDYTADQVPGIIRSIYAYHVRSRGWRDVGYNFLVDRFGRIWEGRWGGIDKAVVGAHTSGYNANAFAMAAIGNFETAQPSAELLRAYGALMGWKLALSGVSASATDVRIGSRTFASSIMGHRDAGQTACPGANLHAQLGQVRRLAAAAQGGSVLGPAWVGRDTGSDLVGSAWPDLVLRRAADGRGVVLPTEGTTRYTAPSVVSRGWRGARRVLVTRDVTGDGRDDLVVVGANGTAKVRPGDGAGRFGKTRALRGVPRGLALLTAAGDLDGDRRGDLVGRTSTGRLQVLLTRGAAKRSFTATTARGSWKAFRLLVGAGDLTGDGRDDLAARDARGRLVLFTTTKKGLPGKKSSLGSGWGTWDAVVGGGDHTGDGRDDLVVRRARTGEVHVLPGLGQGRLGTLLGPVAVLGGADQLGAGSLGADGRSDLLARVGAKLVRLDNAGTRELGAPVETDLDLRGATRVVNAGDFDRDGAGDVLVRDAAGVLTLRPGNRAGGFGAPVVLGSGFGAVEQLTVVADRTGDGLPEVHGLVGGAPTLWPGQGRAPLRAAQATTPGPTLPTGYDLVAPVADGNGDGVPDVVARRGTELYLLPGSALGFGTPRFLGAGAEAYDLVG